MARFHKHIREQLEEQIRQLVEVEKLQQILVAQQLGVSKSFVERACKRVGIKTQRTGPRSGSGHTGWKGGIRIVKGYRYLYAIDHPNRTKQGYVAEHRLQMEKHLGRYLLRGEVVHHIDGNPLNNQIENLQLFSSNAKHLKHELTGRHPNWSEDGARRVYEGLQKGWQVQKENTIARKQARDGSQQLQNDR